jgi:hypothetical protein
MRKEILPLLLLVSLCFTAQKMQAKTPAKWMVIADVGYKHKDQATFNDNYFSGAARLGYKLAKGWYAGAGFRYGYFSITKPELYISRYNTHSPMVFTEKVVQLTQRLSLTGLLYLRYDFHNITVSSLWDHGIPSVKPYPVNNNIYLQQEDLNITFRPSVRFHITPGSGINFSFGVIDFTREIKKMPDSVFTTRFGTGSWMAGYFVNF